MVRTHFHIHTHTVSVHTDLPHACAHTHTVSVHTDLPHACAHTHTQSVYIQTYHTHAHTHTHLHAQQVAWRKLYAQSASKHGTLGYFQGLLHHTNQGWRKHLRVGQVQSRCALARVQFINIHCITSFYELCR